jgi:hypothetical protein
MRAAPQTETDEAPAERDSSEGEGKGGEAASGFQRVLPGVADGSKGVALGPADAGKTAAAIAEAVTMLETLQDASCESAGKRKREDA